MSEDQYRESADQCIQSAKAADSDEERKKLLTLAETYLQSAIAASLKDAFGGASRQH